MVSLSDVPFAATSEWNLQIGSDATFTKVNWPGTTGYNYSVAWDAYTPAVYVASPSDPVVQVSHPASWGWPAGTVSVHMPAAANGAAGTDGELIVIDGDMVYNFWQFKRTSNTTATTSAFGAENIVTGDGWGSKSPFQGAGITAIGASQLGGLIVEAETKDGSIDHALQLVVDRKLVQAGFTGPAINGDGASASGIVQEGQRLAIPPGTPMPAGLSPLGQQVFRAMQQYGAYVVDVADGVTNVRAQSNAFNASTMTALWHDMGSITPLLQGVKGSLVPPTSGGGGGTSPDTTAPTIQWIAANGTGITNGNGTVGEGSTVRLAVNFSETVNVTGTPTLALNSGGTATYVSGAGTNTLQFDYKVGAGQNAADLAITGFNLSGVKDLAGNVANVAGAPTEPAGTLVVNTGGSTTPPDPTDTTAPTIQWVAANGTGITNGNGTVGVGSTVRLAVNFNEAVNVTGTPSLALNSGGTATYVSGAGTNTLQFDYKVGAGQNAADLAITGFNLSGVKDLAGNAVNLTGAPTQPAGTLVVSTSGSTDPTDTTAPTMQWVAANGTGITNGNGTVGVGGTVRLSVKFSEAVNVTGTPTLSLNSNGTAKYVGGSGTDTLQFDYKVSAGQNAADLAITGFNLNGVKDLAGNGVSLTGAPTEPAGTLVVNTKPTDTTAPTMQWVAANGTGITNGNGAVGVDGTVRLSVKFSEAVNVTGTPSMALNSGGTATYVSGAGSDTLQFDYKVAAGQSAADLAISGFNLNGVKDLAGNSLNLAGAPRQPAGTLVIDTTAPRLQWVAANGTGVKNGTGTVGVGGTVRLSLNFTEAVNVTGKPTLSLNSGGTATYVSGSGGTTLQFDYKVGAGQNAADLEISGFNLSGVKDRAGNSVNTAGAPHQPAGTLAIRTTAPAAATLTSAAATSASVADLAATAAQTSGTQPSTEATTTSSSSITDPAASTAATSGTSTGTATTSSSSSTTDLAANAAVTSGAEASTNGAPAASGSAANPNLDAWSRFLDQIADAAGRDWRNPGVGSGQTLGYTGDHNGAGANLAAAGAFVAKMALLGQYSASSFASSSGAFNGTPIHDAVSAALTPVLTKPQAAQG